MGPGMNADGGPDLVDPDLLDIGVFLHRDKQLVSKFYCLLVIIAVSHHNLVIIRRLLDLGKMLPGLLHQLLFGLGPASGQPGREDFTFF